MKRKPHASPEPLIDQKLFEEAKLALDAGKIKRASKCSVCGSACAPNSAEDLCWVCRRLKISAWRDSDQQTAQE